MDTGRAFRQFISMPTSTLQETGCRDVRDQIDLKTGDKLQVLLVRARRQRIICAPTFVPPAPPSTPGTRAPARAAVATVTVFRYSVSLTLRRLGSRAA